MPEIWKPCLSSERHEVSNPGRVRTVSGRVLKCRPDKDGYHMVSLWDGSKIITGKVHRLVYEAHVHPLGGQEIDHKNRDRADNRLTNLRTLSRVKQVRATRRSSKSRTAGVRYRDDKSRWQAYANENGKFVSLGHFATRSDAYKARKTWEKEGPHSASYCSL